MKGWSIVLLFVLTLSPWGTSLAIDDDATFVDHDSISIDGDGDLTPSNGITGGNGTREDPYTIENYAISGPNGIGLRMNNTGSHVLIRNLSLTNVSGVYSGIYLFNVTNCRIENITAIGLHTSIEVYNSTDIVINGCNLTRGNLIVRYTDGIRIEWTTVGQVYGKLITYGFRVSYSQNIHISNCIAYDCEKAGIDVYRSVNMTVVDNLVRDMPGRGIDITGSWWTDNGMTVISRNIIIGCKGSLTASELEHSRIEQNRLERTLSGMIIKNCTVLSLKDNTLESSGILLTADTLANARMEFSNNTLAGRQIRYIKDARDIEITPDAPQVILANCSRAVITDYSSNSSTIPIQLLFSSDTRVVNCTLSEAFSCVDIQYCNDTVVVGCHISSSQDGVSIYKSVRTDIVNNTVDDVTHGAFPQFSHSVNISHNKFTNSTYGIRADQIDFRIRWQIDHIYDDNTFINTSKPIMASALVDYSISNNKVTDCSSYGITLRLQNKNGTIAGNSITDCGLTGFRLNSLNVSTIQNNSVQSAEQGISISYILNSNITDNIISDCAEIGAYVGGALQVRIVGNTFRDCGNVGLRLWGDNISVYHNNFINTNHDGLSPFDCQAIDLYGETNTWDDGRRGNYWSDYRTRYPGAGNNGRTWSIPYEVETGLNQKSYDNHPLVNLVDLIPPKADAGEDLEVDEGTTVRFNGKQSTDNIGIVSYRWTFQYLGRTTLLSGPEPSHDFEIPGVYLITLNVSDSWGSWDTDTLSVTVNDVEPPSPVAGRDVTVLQGQTVTFNGTLSYDSGGIANFTWTVDFGSDPRKLHGAVVDLVCDIAGDFTVTLNTTDHVGHSAYDTLQLQVLDTESPSGDAGNGIESVLGSSTILNGSASSDNVAIVNWSWSFMNNDTEVLIYGEKTSFTFEFIGTYDITLTVLDARGNMATDALTVRVIDTSAPRFTEPDLLVGIRETENLSLDYHWTLWEDDDPHFPVGAKFSWVFKNNETLVSADGNHPWIDLPNGGWWEVTFTATDLSGNTGSHSFRLRVDWRPTNATPPSADAGLDNTVALFEQTHLLGSFDRGELEVVNISWSVPFDPQLYVYYLNLTFTPDRIGTWELTLRVIDWMGNEGVDWVNITVVPRIPIIEFEQGQFSDPISGPIVIRGNASGDVDIIRVEFKVDEGNWTVADGTTSWSVHLDSLMLENGPHQLYVRAWDGYRNGEEGPTAFEVFNEETVDDPDGDRNNGYLIWLVALAIIVLVLIASTLFMWNMRRGSV